MLKYPISFFLCLMIACNDKPGTEQAYDAKFVTPQELDISSHSILHIPTKSNQSQFSAIEVLENDTTFQLWGFDQNTFSIFIYDLKREQYLKKISFNRDGPQNIPFVIE